MNLNLRKKNVLITGSSRGIGLEIAKHFAEENCNIVLNGRAESGQDALGSIPFSHYVSGDVSTEQGAKKVVSEAVKILGSLDVVVCNVGSGTSVKPGQETLAEWQQSFSVNLFSTTCTVEAAKSYLEQSSGVVICISSICGCEIIPGAPVTYSVAKAALNAYIRGISRPLGDQGVRICGIAPGNVLFDGSVWDRKMADDSEAVSEMLEQNVALKTLGYPEQIASLATFLASSKSNFTTGCVLIVDGGQTRTY
jgi:NAD(P)-dependent dehydrogenase (short-subunit alcohol dehydrogenase family)